MFECYDELKAFISERVGRLRSQKNMSARDLSLTIGSGETYINNIESGKAMPSMEGLFNICEYFKISQKEFFDDGTEAPALLSELNAECSKLDEKALRSVIEIVKNMKK